MMNSLGERWGIAGNIHLLAHFRATISANPRRYGTPASYRHNDASPEWISNVNRIVAAKNVWVKEMLDIAINNGGEVPSELQRQIWDDLIGRAEAALELAQAA